MEETNVRLKLLIDTESHRVLFAEAGKDFIDFLFHILALPVGTFIPLLKKQGMVGSLGSIYESIESLSTTYLQPKLNKETLLKPKANFSGCGTGVPLLLPNVESSSTSMKFYRCERHYGGNCNDYVANYENAICPSCQNVMTREVRFVDPPSAVSTGSSSSEGGYVKGVVTYMVMDNLEVKPMSTISSITLLNKFDVKEIGALEEKVVELGMDEGVKLLKASLQSKSVLTDVFLPTVKVETEVQ
ncbi:uncharacterized protein LOC142638827 [Castanea sativa]|uniref:uncharacterized protein LOC142638827 n=1 Tax=Castanea sativa TaxID=21020 RepID=UPI003F64C1F8